MTHIPCVWLDLPACFLYVAEKLEHLKVCVFLDDMEKDTVSYYPLGRQ